MNPESDIIDIRPDERLDSESLEFYLRGRLPNADRPLRLAQFGGGHANLTYLLQFGEQEYVLRRPPLGPIAPGSHDMGREHRVMAALAAVTTLVPKSFLLCEDEAIIGAPFHVLERRRGIVIREHLPAACEQNLALRQKIGEMLVDVLATLHKVDPAAAGLGDLGRPDGFVERQLSGWARRWQAARHDDDSRLTTVIRWLERRLPQSQAISLLHNDYKLDNLLVGEDNPSRAVAVLDWDMGTRGDPLMDFGYLLTFWGEAGDDPSWIKGAAMPTWHSGFASRDEAVQRYAAASGFDLSEIHWYHVFGVFKIAVVLQQIYIRFLRGQTQDQRFAALGERIDALSDKAIALTGRAGKP